MVRKYIKLAKSAYRIGKRYAPVAAAAFSAFRGRGNRLGSSSGSLVANKFKFKGNGSRTKTMTKKKKRFTGGRQSIFDGRSKCVIRTGKYRTFIGKVERVIGAQYNRQYTQVLSASSSDGFQAATYTGLYPTADIITQANDIASGTAYKTQSTYLDFARQDLTVVNRENNDCFIWFYDLMLRNDDGVLGLNPIQDWAGGIIDEYGGSTDYTQPYSTPYQSKKFTTRWKIVKVSKFCLSAGATHVHRVEMNPKHKINMERVTDTNSTGTGGALLGVGRLTTCCMIIALGGLVNDSSSEATCTGKVTISVLNVTKYKYWGLPSDNITYNKSGTLGSITTGQFMNEKTAAILAEAFA